MKHLIAALLFVGALSLTAGPTIAQSQTRDDVLREIETKRAELEAKRGELGQLEKEFLSPSAEDLNDLLRSIGYRASDVLVAFKVVRQDTDGSVILAWKLLKKYPVPTLALSE
ncbi:MAG: hypothetical protein AABN95_23880 [Acidobacteriota bacterium]